MRSISKTRTFAFIVVILMSLGVVAQEALEVAKVDRRLFNHLDLGVTAGSGGIGLELYMPVTDWARVRAGVGYMPHFNVPMTFNLYSYVKGEGVVPISDKMDKVQELLDRFTGVQIDEKVNMNAHATMWDARLLVDIYPFKSNRHFYATVGFYLGTSKIGHIENTMHEMPSLVGLMVYNNLYDFFIEERYWDEPLVGDFGFDIDVAEMIRDKLAGMGKIGAHLGDFKDTGDPYLMIPDKDGLLQADMFVNKFKPYLGVGYETAISKDKRWHFSGDLGVLFWGGAPSVRTHENVNHADLNHDWKDDGFRVDMINDLNNVRGKVGDYLEITSKMKAYPILNFKISYTIF